jgi:WD40 repeat protein
MRLERAAERMAKATRKDSTEAISLDKTARVWDATTGKSLATLSGHSKPVVAVAFSPDGSRIVTASDDHSARLWPSWRWDPVAFARLDVGRQLTCDERRDFLHEKLDCAPEHQVLR